MRCKAKTKAGDPCAAPPRKGRPYCYHHDPEMVEERQASRRRGGFAVHGMKQGESKDVRIREVNDVLRLLERAAGDVLARKPSIARARALAYLASTSLKALEVGAIEERVAALEARTRLEVA